MGNTAQELQASIDLVLQLAYKAGSPELRDDIAYVEYAIRALPKLLVACETARRTFIETAETALCPDYLVWERRAQQLQEATPAPAWSRALRFPRGSCR